MELIERYLRVRARSEALAAPLSAEDQQVQSMPSCSPTKWHRAHTTWFFETFVLTPFVRGHAAREHSSTLFNSYYEALGERVARAERGLLTRPSLAEVLEYRAEVDDALLSALAQGLPAEALARVELGLHHEQQHQELLLTDVLHLFSRSPLEPAYQARNADEPPDPPPARASWVA
ncbi:MAG: DinB family protein, partial [Planctomycetes bacterium]|nr:DinB family protein [Planctomycetota bacterium]